MEPTEAKKLAQTLMNQWGLSDWTFQFDNAKRRFGQCRSSRKTISISRPLTKLNDMEIIKDTILHEIAHALDYLDRGTSDHSYRWKRWARKVGARPIRCESGGKTPKRKYVHYCPNCDQQYPRYRKSHKPSSCGRCSKSFSMKYPLIMNLPATKVMELERINEDWPLLTEAQRYVEKLVDDGHISDRHNVAMEVKYAKNYN